MNRRVKAAAFFHAVCTAGGMVVVSHAAPDVVQMALFGALWLTLGLMMVLSEANAAYYDGRREERERGECANDALIERAEEERAKFRSMLRKMEASYAAPCPNCTSVRRDENGKVCHNCSGVGALKMAGDVREDTP